MANTLTLFFLGTLLMSARAIPARAQSQPGGLIHVEIVGLRNDRGQVLCALFSSASDFPKSADKATARTKSDISHGTASCEFSGIAPGTYAVSVFHDENMNRKLDKNFVGVPKEGYGASNNPKKKMGPPSFEETKFELGGSEQSLEIKLMY